MFNENQKVKDWTIIKKAPDRYAGKNQKRVFYWLCECKCGHIQEVEQQRLKHPTKNNCCLACSSSTHNLVDYSGKKFNFITLIEPIKNNKIIYKCKCDCGNEFEELGSKIASGGRRSCGLCGKRNRFVTEYKQQRLEKPKPGDKFNRLEIIREIKYPYYECKCNCGTIRQYLVYDLIHNKSKSCGCLKSEVCSEKLRETIKRITIKKFKCTNLNQLSRLYLIPFSLRKIIRNRDNNKCCICENTEKLVIHHIIPYQENKELLTKITNLITICRKCHYKAHDNNFHGNVNSEIQDNLKQIAILNTEKLDVSIIKRYDNIVVKAKNNYNNREKAKG